MAMSGFFVLSGFGIHYSYTKRMQANWRQATRAFLLGRVCKIYPLYWLLLAVALWTDGYAARMAAAPQEAAWLPLHLLGVQNWWLFATDPLGGLFGLSWAVSVELCCYAAFPLLFLGVVRLNTRRNVLAAMAAVFVCTACWLMLLVFRWPQLYPAFRALWFDPATMTDAGFTPVLHSWLSYSSPLVRLPEFALGMLTAQLLHVEARSLHQPPAPPVLWMSAAFLYGLGTAAVLIDLSFAAITFRSALFPAVPAVLTIYLLVREADRIPRLFLSPRILTAAQATYCLYMLQYFTLHLFETRPQPVGDAAGLAVWAAKVLVSSALTMFLAHWLNVLVETPVHRRLQQALARR